VQKSVLGKGLASLLPGASAPPSSAPVVETAEAPAPALMGTGAVAAGVATPVISPPETGNRDRHMGIALAAIEEIEANPYQPRRDFDEKHVQELSDSIKVNGIIQPLIVRKGANGYQLIAGERRLRAAKLAGLKQVPIVVRRSTDREALELALIENVQRQDLNCVDEALAYFQLTQEFTLTQEEIAVRVGKERATVANSLRLLKLPEPILEDLKQGTLSPGHGKVLLSLDNPSARLSLRAEILEKNMSVRQAEVRVLEIREAEAAAQAPASGVDGGAPKSPLALRLSNLAQELTRHWSAKIEVRGTEKKGKIVIHYRSREDLDRVLSGLQSEQPWQKPLT
jgi:ParB family transcriptional regulator, chromosome partitioning protein